MKIKRWLGGLLVMGACGCSGMNHTESGALGGGLIGAGAGTVIGGLMGHPGLGAAAGAGIGAGTGALIGNGQDRADARRNQAAADYAARNPPLGIPDVVQMTQQHIGEETIIRQMESTHSYYNLTTNDIIYMKQQGVSDRVIGVMQGRRAPGPGLVHGRPVRTVYVVEPAPPPVAVGVGFGFSSGPRCRH